MLRTLTVVCGLALFAVCLHAGDAALAALVEQSIKDAGIAGAAQDSLDAAYAKPVNEIAAKLATPDEAARAEPQFLLDRLEFNASRPGAENERKTFAKATAAHERDAFVKAAVAALNGARSVPAQKWLLRAHERAGREEAIAAEAKLLNSPDEHMRELAARALAANRSPAAAEELVKSIKAAADARNRARADCRHSPSAATRRNVALFEAEAQNADPGVKAAVLAALAAMGRPALSNTMREAAQLVELGRTGGVAALPKLIEALRSTDAKLRQAAVQGLNFCARAGTHAGHCLSLWIRSRPRSSRRLLAAIAQREDGSAIPAIAKQIKSDDPATRVAAIRALGRHIGNGRQVLRRKCRERQ